ncbi:MAG: hypothetical protein G8345_13585 [Magnetococcales bacterium]|nr:hypothetical protein [Magnetococcales bacterium]
MERAIAAIRLPGLALTAARLREPQLADQPLVILRHGRVWQVDQQSWQAGVRPGMTGSMLPLTIRQRPPAVEEERYLRQKSHHLLDTLTPVVEETRQGHWLIDLSGTSRLHQAPEVVTLDRLLHQLEEQLATPVVAGMAANRTVALLAEAAALASHSDWIRVLPGQEHRFLAPLPVTLLPRVGQTILPRLHRLGIHCIGDLLACPVSRLVAVFGNQAHTWRHWGMGMEGVHALHQGDPPPAAILEPGPHRQSLTALRAMLLEACDTIGQTLRQQHCYLAALRLGWSDLDGQQRERRLTLQPPEDRTAMILDTVWQGVEEICQRRVMVRRITLTLLRTTPNRPRSLFPELDPPRPVLAKPGLDEAMDAIRHRYGRDAIHYGPLWRMS